MTTIESKNTPLPPNKRKPGRRRNRGSQQSPQKERGAPFSTPPKPTVSCSVSHGISQANAEEKVIPSPEDLIPETVEARSTTSERNTQGLIPRSPANLEPQPMLSPAMVAHMKSVLSGGTPPSPPKLPRIPPSPSPDVFDPSELMDAVLLRESPKPSVLMLDRAQFSPGMFFDPNYSAELDQTSQAELLLAAQLDRSVQLRSPARMHIRSTAKKRGSLASIVEGAEPPSRPQFPGANEAAIGDPLDDAGTQRTPSKKRPFDDSDDTKEEETGDLIFMGRRAEIEEGSAFGPTKIDFEEEEEGEEEEDSLEPFAWLEGSDVDYDPSSSISMESPISTASEELDEFSDPSCTEEEYSRFAVKVDEPVAEVDLHVTPRGRRLPLFSRTPEWTAIMGEAKMQALGGIGGPAVAAVAQLPEPISPVLAPELLEEVPDVGARDLLGPGEEPPPSPTLSVSLNFDQLNFEEGDEDTLPDQSIAQADAALSSPLPSPLPPSSSSPLASPKFSMSLQEAIEASTPPCSAATLLPRGGALFTPPSINKPAVVLSSQQQQQLSPVKQGAVSSPRVLWRIATPVIDPATTATNPMSKMSPLKSFASPSASPSKFRAASTLGEFPSPHFSPSKSRAAAVTPVTPSQQQSSYNSPSASPLPGGLRFELPFTPSAPNNNNDNNNNATNNNNNNNNNSKHHRRRHRQRGNQRNKNRSPATPSTPQSPIKHVDPQLLQEGAREEEEEDGCEVDFVYPDVSAEIQTGSDRYLMSMRALANGCLGDALQTPVKTAKPGTIASSSKKPRNNNNNNNNNNNSKAHEKEEYDEDDAITARSSNKSQFPLREQLLADPELKQQLALSTPSANTNNTSVFATMTPLSPLIRAPWTVPSPQPGPPSLRALSDTLHQGSHTGFLRTTTQA